MTAPFDALPPDQPATVEDVRAARRWTWVALAWAVAASAIAAIALVNSNNNSDNQPTQTGPDLSAQIAGFEKQTNDRLDAFGQRLSATATEADAQKLDKRLTAVEDAQSKAKDDEATQAAAIKQLQADVKDLQQRVGQLESSQQGQTTTP